MSLDRVFGLGFAGIGPQFSVPRHSFNFAIRHWKGSLAVFLCGAGSLSCSGKGRGTRDRPQGVISGGGWVASCFFLGIFIP